MLYSWAGCTRRPLAGSICQAPESTSGLPAVPALVENAPGTVVAEPFGAPVTEFRLVMP